MCLNVYKENDHRGHSARIFISNKLNTTNDSNIETNYLKMLISTTVFMVLHQNVSPKVIFSSRRVLTYRTGVSHVSYASVFMPGQTCDVVV